MHELCIRDLTEILTGRLTLASMPPIGGELEPIGRIVTQCNRILPGDVLFGGRGLNGNAGQGTHCPEEALARGALGVVVAGRHVEPWAGTFSLEVPDARAALWELAGWARRRFTGKLIAVAGNGRLPAASSAIDRVLCRHLRGARAPNDATAEVAVPLAMLTWDPTDDYSVVEFDLQQEPEASHLANLCAPDIGVITDRAHHAPDGGSNAPHCDAAEAELLGTLSHCGWAVLDGDSPRLRRLSRGSQANVIWFGHSPNCDIVAGQLPRQGAGLEITIDGVTTPVGAPGERVSPSLLAACAVGKAMGMAASEIATAVADWSATGHDAAAA